MKKIIVLALFIGLLCTSVFAATSEVVSGDSIKNAQTRIDQIGFRLLNYNGIEKRTVFDYDIKSGKMNAENAMYYLVFQIISITKGEEKWYKKFLP